MPRKLTEADKLALRAVWLQAHSLDKAVTIKTGSAADAVQLRFALYRVCKGLAEEPDRDRELFAAMEGCQLSLSGPNVVIQPRALTKFSLMLASSLEQVGLAPQAVSNKSAEESFARLTAMMQSPEPEVPANPYPLEHGQ